MVTELSNFNLLHNNTFRMNVSAYKFIDYTEPTDLPHIFANIGNTKFRCIGQGSNLLFTGNYDGILLHSSILNIESKVLDAGHYFSIGSGVDFDSFIEMTAAAGIWGLENLSDIPGCAGSAAVQNIGAYGVEIADFIESVDCYDIQLNKFVRLTNEQCNYSYRNSIFKLPENRFRYIVTAVNIFIPFNTTPRLSYGNLETALKNEELTPKAVRNAVKFIRSSKLPSPDTIGSAGSFFMNPMLTLEEFNNLKLLVNSKFGPDEHIPHYNLNDDRIKIPAAWLIDKCGWKGRRHGNAACWELQPLVLVNATGNATPNEILELENLIINDVKSTFGITLKPEVDHI